MQQLLEVVVPAFARLHCATALRDSGLGGKQMAKRRKRRYSRGAGTEVKREMHRYKRGTARSGRGAGRVKSRKQAIAIGLSKARKKGKKVPRKAS
jgi:Family of unknown function (DUF6496)